MNAILNPMSKTDIHKAAIKRKPLISALLSFGTLIAASTFSASTFAATTPVWDAFVKAKAEGKRLPLPDFSYAGYKKGEKAIPTPNWKVFNVTNYGATPGDNTDDLAAVNRAIAAAKDEPGGGIVFFPKGRYLLSEKTGVKQSLINVTTSNLILRGEGDGPNGTELFFKEHLDSKTPALKYSTPAMLNFNGSNSSFLGSNKTEVKTSAKMGDFKVEVKNASAFKAGNYVYFNQKDPSAAHANALPPYEVESNWSKFKTGEFRRELHQVKSVSGNTLTLEAPLAMDIDAKYKWEVRLMTLGTHFGLEDMTLRGNWKDNFSHHKNIVHDSGWTGISINKYADSWVKNVRLIDWNSTLNIGTSIFMSALNVTVDGTRGHSGIHVGNSYGILISHSSDIGQKGQFHAQGVSAFSANIVFHRLSWPQDTTLDAHASFPHATLFDRVDGGFSGSSGGNGGADASQPNHLEDLVFWNFKDLGKNSGVTHNWWRTNSKYHRFYLPKMVGWHGALANFLDGQLGLNESYGTKVEPESLYEAQLALRLGQLPAWLKEVNGDSASPTPNVKPTVSFTAPTAEVIQEGQTLLTQVNAADTDGTITTVSLWVNDTLVSNLNASPYQWGNAANKDALLKNVKAGYYLLKAQAVDNNSATIEATKPVVVSKTYNLPALIEAETYAAAQGVQIEPTEDATGAFNIGWLNSDDVMEYSVDVAQAGTYTLNVRYASAAAASKNVALQFELGTAVLGELALGATGGWQSWESKALEVELSQGKNTLFVRAKGGTGYLANLNYFDISQKSTPPPAPKPLPVVTVQNKALSTTRFNEGSNQQVVMAFTVKADSVGAQVTALSLKGSGNIHEVNDISTVTLAHDKNNNGIIDNNETLGQGQYAQNNGTLNITFSAPLNITTTPMTILVGYNF